MLSKTAETKIAKLGTGIVHHDSSPSNYYCDKVNNIMTILMRGTVSLPLCRRTTRRSRVAISSSRSSSWRAFAFLSIAHCLVDCVSFRCYWCLTDGINGSLVQLCTLITRCTATRPQTSSWFFSRNLFLRLVFTSNICRLLSVGVWLRMSVWVFVCLSVCNITKKLAPYGTDGRLLRNLRPFQVWSHVTQKLGQISKISSTQNLDIFHSFRISGHLPAHIKNTGGDRFWKLKKIEEFLTLKVWWPWPWIGSWGIP